MSGHLLSHLLSVKIASSFGSDTDRNDDYEDENYCALNCDSFFLYIWLQHLEMKLTEVDASRTGNPGLLCADTESVFSIVSFTELEIDILDVSESCYILTFQSSTNWLKWSNLISLLTPRTIIMIITCNDNH